MPKPRLAPPPSRRTTASVSIAPHSGCLRPEYRVRLRPKADIDSFKSPSGPTGLVIIAPIAFREAVQEPTLEQLAGDAPLSDCRRTPIADGTAIGGRRPSPGTADAASGVCCWLTAAPAQHIAVAAW